MPFGVRRVEATFIHEHIGYHEFTASPDGERLRRPFVKWSGSRLAQTMVTTGLAIGLPAGIETSRECRVALRRLMHAAFGVLTVTEDDVLDLGWSMPT